MEANLDHRVTGSLGATLLSRKSQSHISFHTLKNSSLPTSRWGQVWGWCQPHPTQAGACLARLGPQGPLEPWLYVESQEHQGLGCWCLTLVSL